MIRGTTPTLCFRMPFDTDILQNAYVSFANEEDGNVIVEKTLEECEVDGNTLTLTLTQEDTLKLRGGCRVYIQIRAKTKTGEAIASRIIDRRVEKILKDGVI